MKDVLSVLSDYEFRLKLWMDQVKPLVPYRVERFNELKETENKVEVGSTGEKE